MPATRCRRVAAALAAGVASFAGGCSTSRPTTAPTGHYGVGAIDATFVDGGRSTPAWHGAPSRPDRTLRTTIFYPAETRQAGGPRNPVPQAPPDRRGAPYPLIVFAHGLGSDPAALTPLLAAWASAGYVVAAPRFPLTSAATIGGPDPADYVSQPADMSFVVSRIVSESAGPRGPLSALVDTRHIGAGGHSLGGVTALGLVANTCCRDARVKAAVVMSGDPITFASGIPDYRAAPPILLVHADADTVIPYVSSIDVFNRASAPKGLLTIAGGGHGSPVDPAATAFPAVVRATTDFFDRFLKQDAHADRRLAADGDATGIRLVYVPAGRRLTVPVPSTVVARVRATAAPDRGLADGQSVTVHWDGSAPGLGVNVLQCSKSPPTSPDDCSLQTARLSVPSDGGSGEVSFVVHTGRVGAGTCDATHPCVIVVNEGGSMAPSATAIVPISFAPA